MSYPGPEAPFDEASLTEGVLMRRALAWLVDFLLLGVVLAVLWVLLGLFGLVTLGLGLPLLALLPVVPFAYHTLFIAGPSGATPGQSLMDLTVRRDVDLGQASFLQAMLFTGGLYLTLSAGAVWLAAALFMPRKRALHDLISGLVVVRRGALTPAPGFVNMPRGPDRI